MTGATVPTRCLRDDEESRYVKTVRRILRAARLNNQYPDARALASHVSALAPEIHRGLYPGLDVDLRSGLPSYREWTRAQTDVVISPDQLRQLGDRATLELKAERGPAIHTKQLAKHDYYTDLAKVKLAPLGDMKVALRRLEPEVQRAHFHVVLDKLDATGFFVRYSIDLAQTSDFWTEKVVVLDEEAARHTETFRSLIYKFTSFDSEFTFVKLATMGGLEVERVVKGIIGPFCFPWVRGPEPLKELLSEDGYVAMFALDMAAIDLAADRDNDPFEDLIIERLSPEARQGYEQAREQYGYKVFKDRKFVSSRELQRDLRTLCAEAGTKNIIYPA